MTANSPAIRVARANRLLAELGHTDFTEALKQMEEMRSALRVVHTWARFDDDGSELVPEHVIKLTTKALRLNVDSES